MDCPMYAGHRQKVCVLGAGIVGITTAWWLHKNGFDVVVIDRQRLPASEASFANGAQISASNASPWANPHTLKILPRMLLGKEQGIFLSPQLSVAQWMWSLRFLYNCRARLAHQHLQKMLAICLRSRDLYRELIEEQDMDFSYLDKGILHFYTKPSDYRDAQRIQDSWGKPLKPHLRAVDSAEILSIEPALADAHNKIVGGFYAAQDMTGDAYKFSNDLARLCEDRGVTFRYDTVVKKITPLQKQVIVETQQEELAYDHIVCCLGAHASSILKPLGITTHIYPMKGYSITIELGASAARAPTVSMLDANQRVVVTRLGSRLRVAGIAELAGFQADIDPRKIEYLHTWLAQLFPQIPLDTATPWAGLRPATPSNLPYVGASTYPRLWLNCGHGTLGWTTAMATAEQVACDILSTQ